MTPCVLHESTCICHVCSVSILVHLPVSSVIMHLYLTSPIELVGLPLFKIRFSMSTEEMDIYQQLMGKWLPSVKLCTYIILPSRAQMLTEQEEKYLFD